MDCGPLRGHCLVLSRERERGPVMTGPVCTSDCAMCVRARVCMCVCVCLMVVCDFMLVFEAIRLD